MSKQYRPRLTQAEMDVVLRFRGEIQDATTDSNEYSGNKILSAWNSDGNLMDIDQYCEYYGLPRADVSSYKLVSHTGTPFYNMVFREQKSDLSDFDFREAIHEALISLGKEPRSISNGLRKLEDNEDVTRLIYTDTHIAMDTNKYGEAMYSTPWNKESIMETCEIMCHHVIANRTGGTLYIDELGDFLDGWDGMTTRKGHGLPQNMTNPEAFSLGLEFKMLMIEMLLPYFNNIICNNVCNDNHSGDFSVILNHSFAQLAELKSEKVVVRNMRKFIEHYYIGNHAHVLSHGKDNKSLKFGFKPKLDSVQIEKIDHYLKHNGENIYRKSEWIEFSKGDSHQMLFDFSTAQDFNYFNYPSLSPCSEWVGTNFKKGHRGFVIQQINTSDMNKQIIPIIL